MEKKDYFQLGHLLWGTKVLLDGVPHLPVGGEEGPLCVIGADWLGVHSWLRL